MIRALVRIPPVPGIFGSKEFMSRSLCLYPRGAYGLPILVNCCPDILVTRNTRDYPSMTLFFFFSGSSVTRVTASQCDGLASERPNRCTPSLADDGSRRSSMGWR
jgi:hypothetical protein